MHEETHAPIHTSEASTNTLGVHLRFLLYKMQCKSSRECSGDIPLCDQGGYCRRNDGKCMTPWDCDSFMCKPSSDGGLGVCMTDVDVNYAYSWGCNIEHNCETRCSQMAKSMGIPPAMTACDHYICDNRPNECVPDER